MIDRGKLNASLEKNTIISDAVKENIEYLITVFNKSFPSVSLDNLSKRLETVEIASGSKLLYGEAIQYASDNNKIIINQTKLNKEESDAKFAMMKTLLSMITAKESYYGFGNNNLLKPLNTGTCEIIANYLVGNEGSSDYLDEQVIVNTLADTVGSDNFIRAFFTNDAGLIKKQLFAKSGSMVAVDGLLEQIANNMATREVSGFSRLGYIQKQILSVYGSGYSFLMNKEALEAGTKLKYTGVDELEQYLKSKNAGSSIMKR